MNLTPFLIWLATSRLFLIVTALVVLLALALLAWWRKRPKLLVPVMPKATLRHFIFPRALILTLLAVFAVGMLIGVQPMRAGHTIENNRGDHQKNIDVVFLLDVSGSTWEEAKNNKEDRDCIDRNGVLRISASDGGETKNCLEVKAIEEILASHPGAVAALIVFGDALVAAAPTAEHEAISETAWVSLQRARVIDFPSGTNIRLALEYAWGLLKKYESEKAPIVILSDLDDAHPVEFRGILGRLKAEGAVIIPIGLDPYSQTAAKIEEALGLGSGELSIVDGVEDLAEVIVPIRANAPTHPATQPPVPTSKGPNPGILVASVLMGSALLSSLLILRPIRFLRRWKDV